MRAADHPSEINDHWTAAVNRGDVPSLLALYEPDAVLVPAAGAPPVRGTAAIEASLQALVALGGSFAFDRHFWLDHGDLALGAIEYRFEGGHAPDGTPVEFRGRTAELARRQPDGTWRYVIDHPFAGPATAPLATAEPTPRRASTARHRGVTVVVELRVEPGHDEAARSLITDAAHGWRDEPGVVDVTVTNDPDEPSRYLVVERFASRAALDEHLAAPGLHRFAGALRPHLAEPPRRLVGHDVDGA